MLGRLKASALTLILAMWSTWVVAQTPPAGAPAPGTQSPTGTTTSADPATAAGDGLNWVWIIVAVVVVAAFLVYFFGRRRTGLRT